MHAPCSLQLTVCVCVCVFKEIAAVKDSLCQIDGTLCGMFNFFCGESSIFNDAKTWTCSTMMLHMLRHKLETTKKDAGRRGQRKLNENSQLMKECNELRTENITLKRKVCRDL